MLNVFVNEDLASLNFYVDTSFNMVDSEWLKKKKKWV